jgi:hypothetical protein
VATPAITPLASAKAPARLGFLALILVGIVGLKIVER